MSTVSIRARTVLVLIVVWVTGTGCSSLVPSVPFIGAAEEDGVASDSSGTANDTVPDTARPDAQADATISEVVTPASSRPVVAVPPLQAGSQALFDRGIALMTDGNDAAALVLFEELTVQQPELAGPWVNIGLIQRRADDVEAARAAFEKALQANPQNCSALNLLGVMSREHGLFEESEAYYRRCIAADPTYADAYLNLGILYELYLGRLGAALAAYNDYQVHSTNPDARVAGWLLDVERRAGAVAQR